MIKINEVCFAQILIKIQKMNLCGQVTNQYMFNENLNGAVHIKKF